MPRHPSAITGAAGEHLVAGRLAAMGCVVALTRGGSPTADLLVTNQAGNETVTIQVKTSTWAGRWRKRDPSRNKWEWPISRKAAELEGDRLLYAFVDLQEWPDSDRQFQVFIVPSEKVASWARLGVEKKWSRIFFEILASRKDDHLERWDRVTDILEPANE